MRSRIIVSKNGQTLVARGSQEECNVEKTKAIEFLKHYRDGIILFGRMGEEDESAAEFYGHISDVIQGLETNKLTVQQASESLGLNFT